MHYMHFKIDSFQKKKNYLPTETSTIKPIIFQDGFG